MRPMILAVLLGLGLAAPASAADKLTLLLDWFVNPDHAPIIVAEELGYFAAADLEIEIIAPAWRSAISRSCTSRSTRACRSLASAR
jgi:putative hydroxymethylpyrimidine transport system substrate-binding protein